MAAAAPDTQIPVPVAPAPDPAGSLGADPADAAPDPYRSFRGAYWSAVHELDTLRLRVWERSRITLPQLRVLFQIRRTPGVTAGQLSKSLGVTFSTMSELVSKLSDRGFVARSTAPGDRRQAPLELTEAGEAEAAAYSDDAVAFLTAIGEALGDRLPVIVAALEELAQVARAVREGEE